MHHQPTIAPSFIHPIAFILDLPYQPKFMVLTWVQIADGRGSHAVYT